MNRPEGEECSVRVQLGSIQIEGDLRIPEGARGIVLFAHGSGSGRHSPRNRFVAQRLHEAGLATLLIDLLTAEEELLDDQTARLRFDIPMLAERVERTSVWLSQQPATRELKLGYFGASTGAAAALVAAARHPVRAVVSRGGRPDLAGEALPQVKAATLLIVGGNDHPVIPLNEWALKQLGSADKQLVIIPHASHLFQEPGTLEEVARLAAAWFGRYLGRAE